MIELKKKKIIKIFENLNETILSFLFVAIIVVLATQVILRTFSFALSWSEEVSRYLFVYMVLGGVALAFKKGAFVSVDFLSNFIPRKINKFIDVIAQILTLLFFIIVVLKGVEYFSLTKNQLTPALRIQIRYIYLALPIFGIQLCYYSFIKLYNLIISIIKRNE